MQYLLTTKERDALTPIKRLQERDEALEVAREIIVKLSGVECGIDYCNNCPLDYLRPINEKMTHKISNHICIKPRKYYGE